MLILLLDPMKEIGIPTVSDMMAMAKLYYRMGTNTKEVMLLEKDTVMEYTRMFNFYFKMHMWKNF